MTRRPTTGYRVEHVSADTGLFIAYTSPKQPVSLEMAESYAAHLERNQCGGRIINNATGETVKQWEGKYPVKQ